MRWKKQENSLQCSFCNKHQDVVGKLISSPSDYPRAYICDECVAVCNCIIDDDRNEKNGAAAEGPELTDQLLNLVQQWIVTESFRGEAAEEFAQMRELAERMFVPR